MGFGCVKTNRECDGCMDCKPDPHYFCPICGEEIYETIFITNDGDVLGCENCAQIKEPWEVINSETD